MKKIVLLPIYHRERECVSISFSSDPELNGIVKSFRGCKWSRSKKTWYVPFFPRNIELLKRQLSGKAEIDDSAVLKYAEAKDISGGTIQAEILLPYQKLYNDQEAIIIHEINRHVLPALREQLKLKAYSSSTVRTYVSEMTQFLKTLKGYAADSLEPAQLRRYFIYCHEQLYLPRTRCIVASTP